jgi:toxin ParE1/3/4
MIQQISKEAEKDLEKIWLHTQENWSVEQADRYLDLLFDEIEYLCKHPLSGIAIDEIKKGYRKSKVKSHLIFYKQNIKKNHLEVIRILHEMMDIENRL